jgi:transcriptional regulator with XRE-family HTH domain
MPAPLDGIDIQLREAVAKRFKEIREEIGVTQEALAHSSGRDKQSYNKNERGKGATIYTINKFCIENSISLKYFFDSPLFLPRKVKVK